MAEFLGSDSPLLRLLAHLEVRQKFLLDGIRLSAQMTAVHWCRLEATALETSVSEKDRVTSHIPALLADVWAVIDNVSRLRDLFTSLHVTVSDPRFAEFLGATHTTRDLRDTIQHLQRLEKKPLGSDPPLGTLAWIYTPDLDRPERSCFMVLAGTLRQGKGNAGLDIATLAATARKPIDHIILFAAEPKYGRASETRGSASAASTTGTQIAVSLTDSISHVVKAVRALEGTIAPRLAGHGSAGSDLLLKMDLRLGEAQN